MIRVLVVQGPEVGAESTARILSSDPEVEIVCVARNGEEAVSAVRSAQPDVVAVDTKMPKADGFEVARRIMEVRPTPIVVVSATLEPKETGTTFRAMESGVLTIVEKPPNAGGPGYEQRAEELLNTVKLMSNANAATWWTRRRQERTLSPSSLPRPEMDRLLRETTLVAIGASAGGPLVLETILSALPRDLKVPLLVVQHMAPGFVHGFADWLARRSGLPVGVPADGEIALPGHVYVGPSGLQMGMRSRRRILVTEDAPESGARPSISYLFRSVAEVSGRHAIGVLLTGMGHDGAVGLRLMKESGATTIVQDEASCLIYSMPARAVESGAVNYVLSPEEIAGLLRGLGTQDEDSSG